MGPDTTGYATGIDISAQSTSAPAPGTGRPADHRPGDDPCPPSPALTLHLTESSLTRRLDVVRRRMADWAAAQGMRPDDVDDLVLATHEALANVADHAYPDGRAEAWLEARHPAPDTLVVTVRDEGRWRTPLADPGPRGHGMRIIRVLAERVEVSRCAVGTTVAMYWSLPQS